MDGPGDGRLVELARLGDHAAYGQLFDRYRGSLYRLALQRLGDPYLAEDVVQETFLRARSSLKTYDPSRRLFPWLASIAINRSTDLWQKHIKLKPVGLGAVDTLTSTADSTWEKTVASFERDRLRGALKHLSSKQRLALLLHDLEGLPYPDVAMQVGTTQLAARSLVCRARAAMRSALRTLGISVLAWRRLWRQARSSLPQGGEWAAGMLSATLTIAMVLSPFGNGPDGRQTASATQLVAPSDQLVTKALPPAVRVASTSPGLRPASGRQPISTDNPVGWRAEVGPRRPGAAGPSGGALRVEVVGPDGQTLYYADIWLDCRDVGRLPDTGPVKTAC